jgi:hypothetical protein
MNQITHLLGLLEHSLNTIKKRTSRKKEDNAVKSVKMTVGISLGVVLYIGLIILMVTVSFFINNLPKEVKIAIGIPACIATLIYTILHITGQGSGYPGSSKDKYHN